MPFLIDGHNLIPKIPGLSLRVLDDEQQLIELLQEYCRLQRKQVEVFFDNAPPGGRRVHRAGNVLARFVSQDATADQAIQERLKRLGRAARNWTVVSSDLAVQNEARAAHARVLSSEEFSRMLTEKMNVNEQGHMKETEVQMSREELDDWLKLFGEQGKD
jgi:predicted RNA-binding protein with PIN domain